MADVTRILKDKKLRGDKGGDIAKLFAKHIKLKEHIAYLKRTKLSAAAGTPGRLGKLLESGKLTRPPCCPTLLIKHYLGALQSSALTHVILDVSYQDAKKRNVLDIPETRDEVFKGVIGSPKVLQGIKQGKIQLVLL